MWMVLFIIINSKTVIENITRCDVPKIKYVCDQLFLELLPEILNFRNNIVIMKMLNIKIFINQNL